MTSPNSFLERDANQLLEMLATDEKERAGDYLRKAAARWLDETESQGQPSDEASVLLALSTLAFVQTNELATVQLAYIGERQAQTLNDIAGLAVRESNDDRSRAFIFRPQSPDTWRHWERLALANFSETATGDGAAKLAQTYLDLLDLEARHDLELDLEQD